MTSDTHTEQVAFPEPHVILGQLQAHISELTAERDNAFALLLQIQDDTRKFLELSKPVVNRQMAKAWPRIIALEDALKEEREKSAKREDLMRRLASVLSDVVGRQYVKACDEEAALPLLQQMGLWLDDGDPGETKGE